MKLHGQLIVKGEPCSRKCVKFRLVRVPDLSIAVFDLYDDVELKQRFSKAPISVNYL